jgi:hypothetical protein
VNSVAINIIVIVVLSLSLLLLALLCFLGQVGVTPKKYCLFRKNKGLFVPGTGHLENPFGGILESADNFHSADIFCWRRHQQPIRLHDFKHRVKNAGLRKNLQKSPEIIDHPY